MKRKLHKELLATAALAVVLTLLFALLVFYGLFKEQTRGFFRTCMCSTKRKVCLPYAWTWERRA